MKAAINIKALLDSCRVMASYEIAECSRCAGSGLEPDSDPRWNDACHTCGGTGETCPNMPLGQDIRSARKALEGAGSISEWDSLLRELKEFGEQLTLADEKKRRANYDVAKAPGKRPNTEKWATRQVEGVREAVEWMNANKNLAFLPAFVVTNSWRHPETVAILGEDRSA